MVEWELLFRNTRFRNPNIAHMTDSVLRVSRCIIGQEKGFTGRENGLVLAGILQARIVLEQIISTYSFDLFPHEAIRCALPTYDWACRSK